MLTQAHTKFSKRTLTISAIIFISISSPVRANNETTLPENVRAEMQKQMIAGCRFAVTEPFIANMFKNANASGQKSLTESDFREKLLGSQEWKDFVSPMIQSLCNCALAKPLADLAAIKNNEDFAPFMRRMADYMELMKTNQESIKQCQESAITQNPLFKKRTQFSEVVVATNAAKIGVEICGQEKNTNRAAWQISGCAGGSSSVPADINNPATSTVASVKTADNGIITATAGTQQGLNGETFILTPTFKDGRIYWRTSGTCLTSTPSLCQAPLGQE